MPTGIRVRWFECLVQGIVLVALLVFFPAAVLAGDADASTEAEMKPYAQEIAGADVSFDMVPIAGGESTIGSPDGEADRKKDEGPQIKVKVEPFWMGKHEVTWDEYDVWTFGLDIQRRKILKIKATERDPIADAITRPTKPYSDMTFGMGHDGFPAICMTQLGAKMYCKWLSAKTGHYYRLPTEAEWEYACRAGSTTAYSFGDDPGDLEDHAWFFDNSDTGYHKVGEKKPNAWGLYDMHGNVSEWVLDQHIDGHYKKFADGNVYDAFSVLAVPKTLFPRVVRGGSWDDDPNALRSSARHPSTLDWKAQDPQIPQSIWYHTDAMHVGFRLVRPLKVPAEEARKKLQLDAPEGIKNEKD